ncbi:MAG: S8 family serine peptidase [Pseudoxanthomonas sp.]|nr:S8 family serine peptidase [Pseudoxanthomonas sp.]
MTSLRLGALALAISFAAGSAGLVAGTGTTTSMQHGPAVANATAPQLDFTLDLGGLRFDPLVAAPAATRDAGQGPDLRLVQFNGPMQPGWLDALADDGAIPMQYVHPYAYIVWSDAQALQQAARRAEVRWSGRFIPEFKVNPLQRGHGAQALPTMALVSRHAGEASVAGALREAGATVHSVEPLNRHLAVVHLDAPGDRYLELAAIAGVYTLQAIPQDAGPRGEMSNQSVVGNHGPGPSWTIVPGYANWLASTGYDGTGVTVGIVDGGIRTSHQDLAPNIRPCVNGGTSPSSCSASNNSHGTHVAGAVGGTGASGLTDAAGFLRGQGVAPGAGLIQQRYGSFLGAGPGGMIPNGMLTIYRESALSGAVHTNNSWGPTGTPQGYDIPTQQIDFISRDAVPEQPGQQPVLAVWSIMNGNGDSGGACAPSSLGGPDEAKNLFAVGSTKLQNTNGTQIPDIFDISANSAHGNACDGRRVPHIVAPGCRTDSTSSGSDTAFGLSCGTSMASPVVSGAVALFVDKYRDNHGGATPSPALIKAAFTAAARNLQGFRNADNGIMGHRPDRFQGYGRLDLDRVMNPAQPVFLKDQDTVFTGTGQSWDIELQAADPAAPMLVMLAWTDAPGHGLGGSTPAWVNNLDLTVTGAGGSFRGNVIGADGWSATGGSADDRNNLEGVFLSPAQHGGSVSLSVLAANIAADALNPHDPGAPAQDFALACYNCVADGTPPEPADLGVTLLATPNPADIGGEVSLLVQAGNFGPGPATGVAVELTLPPELAYLDASAVQSAKSGMLQGADWNCSVDGSEVTCTLAASLPTATLAPALLVRAQVDPLAAAGPVTVTAGIGGGQPDPAPGNDVASVELMLEGKSDLLFAHDFECQDGVPGCDGGNPDIVVIDGIDFVPAPDFTGGSIRWLDGTTCACDTTPYNFNVYGSPTAVQFFWPFNANGSEGGVSLDGTTYAVLASGATIGPASQYLVVTAAAATAPWTTPGNVTDGYLGFRFNDNGTTLYGYARISTGPGGRPLTVHALAYNSAGNPITIP